MANLPWSFEIKMKYHSLFEKIIIETPNFYSHSQANFSQKFARKRNRVCCLHYFCTVQCNLLFHSHLLSMLSLLVNQKWKKKKQKTWKKYFCLPLLYVINIFVSVVTLSCPTVSLHGTLRSKNNCCFCSKTNSCEARKGCNIVFLALNWKQDLYVQSLSSKGRICLGMRLI